MTAAAVGVETQDKEDQTMNFLDYIVVCRNVQCIGECQRSSYAMQSRLSSPRLSPRLIKKCIIKKISSWWEHFNFRHHFLCLLAVHYEKSIKWRHENGKKLKEVAQDTNCMIMMSDNIDKNHHNGYHKESIFWKVQQFNLKHNQMSSASSKMWVD